MSIANLRKDFQKYREHPVFSQINRHLSLFIIASVLTSVASLLMAVVPWAVKYLVDQVGEGFSWTNYMRTLMLFMGALFLRSLLIEVSGSIAALLQARALRNVLSEVHQRMMRLHYKRLTPLSSGKLGSHILNDVQLTVSGTSVMITALIRYPVEVIALFAVLFYIDPVLVPIAAVLAAVMYLLTRARSALISGVFEARILSKGTLFGVITENIRLNKLIRMFNFQENRLALFQNELDTFYQHQVRYTVKQLQLRLLLDSALILGLLGATFYLGKLLHQGSLSISDMSAVLAALLALNTSYKGISKSWIEIRSIFQAGNYLSELLREETAANNGNRGLLRFNERVRDIRYENVAFKHGSRPVLKDINLHLQPGNIYILTGDNGSGKSTIIDLLLQIQTADQGVIRINDMDSSTLNAIDLVDRISIVPQALELFMGTIRYNLLLGNPNASEEEIARTLTITGLDKALHDSNRTLDDQVGENGVLLSLGERQRLAIARALLKNPDVFVFDEPTNNLDRELIAKLPELLDTLVQDRIVLVITHQPISLPGKVHEFHLEDGYLSPVKHKQTGPSQ